MQTVSTRSMIYNTLAAYYDQLVADPEAYDAWTEWVNKFSPAGTFLELACGSGEITHRLAKTHQMSAMDLSAAMVAEAAKKDLDMEIEFSTGDMRDLSSYGKYDAIGCFCDSFNYLLDPADVKSLFKQAAEHLNDGGWFLFDTHSMDRLEEFAQDYEEAGTFDDGTQVQWTIAAMDECIFQDFAFYFPDRTVQEHHMQRVYDPEFLMSLLDEDFEVVDVCTDWEAPGIAPGEKYFFACRKKG